MKYNVGLYRNDVLSHRVKYRNSIFGGSPEWGATINSIGNFGSKDLFSDNSVEISCPYETAIKYNFIKVWILPFQVVGYITNWEYINDNNTRIHYSVDAYTSAVASGRLDHLEGLCERVNSYCYEHFLNLLPEPFAPSDIKQANPDLTLQFTNFLDSVEGFNGGTTWLTDPQVNFILTVSPAVVDFLNIAPFATPSTTFATQFISRSTLNFKGADFTRHYGGIFRGTPLVFTSVENVKSFIKRILSGCGFVTNTSADGYTGLSLRQYKLTMFVESPGGGMVEIGGDDNTGPWTESQTDTYNVTESGGYAWNGSQWLSNSDRRTTGSVTTSKTVGQPSKGLTYCRPITSADIYNLYCIPKVFCRNNPNPFYSSREITGFRNYLDMSGIAAELPDKAKLAAYPYCYNQIVTANGDVVDIIPQSDYLTNTTVFDPNYKIRFKVGFFGGDTPHLMGTIKSARAGDNTMSEVESWFTVRSYPALPTALNDDMNMQMQKDFTNTKQIGAAGANARIQSRLNNPFKGGFTDGVGGADTAGQGAIGNAWGAIGAWGREQAQAFGRFMTDGVEKPFGWAKNLANGGGGDFFQDPSQSAAAMAANALQGQIISPSGNTIMGNDFLGQFQVLPVSVYNRGATDAELFSFARYLAKFGSAVSGPLNPRTNIGLLFGNPLRCIPQPFNGRTYYQFLDMEIDEVIPRQWKDAIEAMFISGMWMVEN